MTREFTFNRDVNSLSVRERAQLKIAQMFASYEHQVWLRIGNPIKSIYWTRAGHIIATLEQFGWRAPQ